MYCVRSFSFRLWQLWAVDDYFFLNLSISVSTIQLHVCHKYAYKYKQHAFDAQLNHVFSLERSSKHRDLAMIRSRFAIRHDIYIYVEKRHTDKHDRLFTIWKLNVSFSPPIAAHELNRDNRIRFGETYVLRSLRSGMTHTRSKCDVWNTHGCFSLKSLAWKSAIDVQCFRCISFDQLSVKCCSPEERQVYAWNTTVNTKQFDLDEDRRVIKWIKVLL